MDRLKHANEYVKLYKNKVFNKYKPGFHLTPQVGWMNDPNGLIEFNGKIHIFYQYHPYHTMWGPMHWGHFVTDDFIHYEIFPIALAPDSEYDKFGCFSGNAIEKDGELFLMYTSQNHPDVNDNNQIEQQQALAFSADGVTFIKHKNNPVIKTVDIPQGGSKIDFRDPKIWKHDNYYLSLISNLALDGTGRLLLFKSEDLVNWKYLSVFVEGNKKTGKMWECPDLVQIGDKSLLLVSPQFMASDGLKYTNLYSSLYMIGDIDFEQYSFKFNNYHEIDSGLDFYAPQVLQMSDGRKVMIAWMQTWNRDYPLDVLKQGFNGMLTLPRELMLDGDKLVQKPIKELVNIRSNKVAKTFESVGDVKVDGVTGIQIELKLKVDMKNAENFSVKLFVSVNEYFSIKFDRINSFLEINRENCGIKISGDENHQVSSRKVYIENFRGVLDLDIFVDNISVEVFAQNGYYVLSATVYPIENGDGVIFNSDNLVKIECEKYDMLNFDFKEVQS